MSFKGHDFESAYVHETPNGKYTLVGVVPEVYHELTFELKETAEEAKEEANKVLETQNPQDVSEKFKKMYRNQN